MQKFETSEELYVIINIICNKQLKLICYKTGGIFSEGYECFWYTAGGNQNVPFGKRIGGKF